MPGKSIANVQPESGKDKKELFAFPNLFKTVKKLLAEASFSFLKVLEIKNAFSSGTTNWYWWKPLFPYILFQLFTPSSG